MKKHPTKVEININAGRCWKFIGPKQKLKPLLTLLPEFNFKAVPAQNTSKSWQEVAKDRINQYGEPGLALRGARSKAEMTQAMLAKKVGTTQYEISKMENDKRAISKKMAIKLAKALKTDYRVFL